MSRRVVWRLAAAAGIVLAIAAGVALHRAVSDSPSLASRAHGLEQSLRCPSCQAESVAASNAPIARSMRSQVDRQLREGQSDSQIRQWFIARYGTDVLLDPSGTGVGLLLWVVPAAVLASGLVATWVVVRRRARPHGGARPARSAAARPLSTSRVLVAGGACLAVGVLIPTLLSLRPAAESAATEPAPARQGPATMTARAWESVAESLDQQHDYAGAARAYRKAFRDRKHDPGLRERFAFDLVRTDHPVAAERVIAPIATDKQRPLAVLVLGLAERAHGEPAAQKTLTGFIQRFPHHPAAAQVRRLLDR